MKPNAHPPEPTVSVVLTAYNASRFIDASVKSALSQSFEEIEVIVVDDGSSDETSDRLSAWRDPRLRVIFQPNGGCASALNTGIRASRGVYIGILDADDVWLPNKLARHIQLHRERPELDVTFSWVSMIAAAGNPLRVPCPRWRGTISFEQLLSDYVIRTSSAVVLRRSAAEQAGMFDSRFVRCIDLEFFLRVSLLRHGNMCAVPEVLTLYRRHQAQRTRDWHCMEEGWNQVLLSARSLAPDRTARVERRARSNMYRYFAALAYGDGNFRDAWQLIGRSVSSLPAEFLREPRNWKMAAAAMVGVALPARVRWAIERTVGFELSRKSV